MAFGLSKLMKLATSATASSAFKAGLKAMTSESGGKELGSLLGKATEERIAQVRDALVHTTTGEKVVAFAHLAEDVLKLGSLVKAARADGTVT